MQDEYARLDDRGSTWVCPRLQLDSGVTLSEVTVRYNTYGTLNSAKNNVVMVFHALTGNADVTSWWGEMVGEEKPLDTNKYYVVSANALGSCYGTLGPSSINPSTGRKYGSAFPAVTLRDAVRLNMRLLIDGLGVSGLLCCIGGSMGAMMALEAAFETAAEVRPRCLVMLCGGGRHTSWQIGFNEVQRQAIMNDPKWQNGDYPEHDPPAKGVSLARQLGMITYRAYVSFHRRFSREQIPHGGSCGGGSGGGSGCGNGVGGSSDGGGSGEFEVVRYLHAQGTKLNERKFDAGSYVALSHMLDSHDVSRCRGKYPDVLSGVTQPCLIIGVKSDILYPIAEQIELAQHIPYSRLYIIDSEEGHDGFLLAQSKLGFLVTSFLRVVESGVMMSSVWMKEYDIKQYPIGLRSDVMVQESIGNSPWY